MSEVVRRPSERGATRTRDRLLDAVGEVIRSDTPQVSITVIAERAGVSTATAYRYFPSLDDILSGYLHRVYVQLRNASHDCVESGIELYASVIGDWLRLVDTYGRVMVQLRPRIGLLARLHQGDLVITTSRDAWERPIRAVLRHEDLPDDMFDYAFFLHNMMFDAREMLDLSDNGLTQTEIKDRVGSAFIGALNAWHAAVGTR